MLLHNLFTVDAVAINNKLFEKNHFCFINCKTYITCICNIQVPNISLRMDCRFRLTSASGCLPAQHVILVNKKFSDVICNGCMEYIHFIVSAKVQII